MRKFHYTGDIAIEYGGTFYALDTFRDGYVDAVRVTPCSAAGGPDNAFWIEALTVLIPESDGDNIRSILSVCGYDNDPACLRGTLATGQARKLVFDAALSYGRYDPANCYPDSDRETVQIGKVLDDARETVEIDTVLRGNANLRRYVRRWMRDRFPG